jgi:hypothetical protein
MAASPSKVVLPGLAREVVGILRRNWALAVVPAAVLGAGADAILLARHQLGAEILLGLVVVVGFEFYVAWAELIVAIDRGEDPPRGLGTMLRRSWRALPALLAASFVAVSVPLAFGGLLVLPGLWLLTMWSLFAPAIVHERLHWRAALGRSFVLVRGAFWPVALAVTGSVLIEHGVIHAMAHGAGAAVGSLALALVLAALVTVIVSPAAAFTISVVYERLLAARTPSPALARTNGVPPRVHAEPPSRGLHPRR